MIGLCMMAALALMAFSATAAQAEPGAKWLIKKADGTVVEVTAALEPEVQVKELEKKTLTLLSKVLGKLFHILCTGMELEGFKLKAAGGSLGKIKFTGCVEIVEGKILPACEPHTGAEKGVLLTHLLKALLLLHVLGDGTRHETILLEPDAEPKVKLPFIVTESSEGCSVGEKVPIIGKISFKDCLNQMLNLQVDHLIEEFPALTKFWIISETVEHQATIDGSVILALTGAHSGLNWAGDPA